MKIQKNQNIEYQGRIKKKNTNCIHIFIVKNKRKNQYILTQ